MPVQINDCRNCGKAPELDYDNSNEDFGLFCNCTYPKPNYVMGFTIDGLAKDWNTLNPIGE